jgi:molybdate-binding protein/DNA-binding XRE family transcriptional regulator
MAGITRQAVGAIESGHMQPSVGIALALARSLGTTVEELFGCEERPAPAAARNASATIAGRTVTHSLATEYLAIEPVQDAVPNVFLAGCDLAVGLLARHALLCSRDVRVLWLPMTNRAGLRALENGLVHATVVHGEITAQRAERMREFVGFELATTQEGWLLAPGNPLGLRGAPDLRRQKARLANRPSGAGARRLLDEQLRRSRVDPRQIVGYDRELPGQLDIGRAIAQDFADAAVGAASVARVFALEFIPLRDERCTLFVPRAALRTPEVRALVEALRSTSYRRDLESLQSYDATKTGERIA